MVGPASAKNTTLNTQTTKRGRKEQKVAPAPVVVVLYNGGEFEEDVEAIQAAAVKLLGPNGRILYPITPNTVPNCVVSSPRLGKVWYGDLDMIAQTDALTKLKVLMNGAMAFSQA